jgi:hypothetical protein
MYSFPVIDDYAEIPDIDNQEVFRNSREPANLDHLHFVSSQPFVKEGSSRGNDKPVHSTPAQERKEFQSFYSNLVEISNATQQETQLFCTACNMPVESTAEEHMKSIAHLFTTMQKPLPGYSIHPSNIGYQLLVNNGWEEGQGLGKDGTGILEPISLATREKSRGLGAEKKQ